MREIKFRAWDIEHNEMVFSGNMPDIGFMKWLAFDFRTILMQYIGIKDKNGKEIYFGDILTTSNSNPEYDLWDKEDYGFTVVEENEEELGVDYSNWAVENNDRSVYDRMFVEVIGNIYENPELIKPI